MKPRGDITAGEIYEDRELLNRLGYGIFDVNFGSAGVGFENVADFTYVVKQDDDPKLYRRRVFDLTGHYYPNKLAKAVWDKIVDHKWVLSEREGHEVGLMVAAHDWLEHYSQGFLKEWTFSQKDVPDRIRSRSEPRKGLVSIVAGLIIPDLKKLLDTGFSVTDVVSAGVSEAFKGKIWKSIKSKASSKKSKIAKSFFPQPAISTLYIRPSFIRLGKKDDKDGYFTINKLEGGVDGLYYVRLIANMTGHTPATPEQAEKLWREVLEHKWYMSERVGHDVGIKSAAIDYFRRLNLLEAVEAGEEA